MKIEELKINAFGNLEDKNISLENGINIIYGKNESGKSTLLKFIIAMFYGVSKNKKGKEIADFDKYKPWVGENYSGKIKYTLNADKTYEVYRDFSKKAAQIYNEKMQDISNDYNINKVEGNEFFYEQTGIDEELFVNTALVYQSEVQLDKKSQNSLLQKITNLVSTGDDSISLKQTMNKLNKKLIEEVGTPRSQGRPINNIELEIEKLEEEVLELRKYNDEKYKYEKNQTEIDQIIKEKANSLDIYTTLRIAYEKNDLKREKIILNKRLKDDYDKRIIDIKSKADTKVEELEKEKEGQEFKGLKHIIFLVISIIIIIIGAILVNYIVLGVGAVIAALSLIVYISSKRKFSRGLEDIDNRIGQENIKKKNENIILEDNKNALKKQIEEAEKHLNQTFKEEKSKIKSKYIGIVTIRKIKEAIDTDQEEIYNIIENIKKEIEDLKLETYKVEVNEESVLKNLEKLAEDEEKLENLHEKKEELVFLREAINLANEEIQESYEKVKQNITPKFTEELSNIINSVSNGKYKLINLNDEKGLIVELENGEYISSSLLSTGTIDQMYIALRIAVLEELSKDNIPLILDEPFVYFDNNRLENILEYLNKEKKQKQILIFTCTKREIESLERLNIKYNKIEI